MQKRPLVTFLCIVVLMLIAGVASYYTTPYVRHLRYLEWRKGFQMEKFTGPVTETKSVNITGCVANPVLAYTYARSTLQFRNGDDRAHILFFRDGKFEVPAHGVRDVHLTFLDTPGSRAGYDCDSKKNAGVVVTFIVASSTLRTSSRTSAAPK